MVKQRRQSYIRAEGERAAARPPLEPCLGWWTAMGQGGWDGGVQVIGSRRARARDKRAGRWGGGGQREASNPSHRTFRSAVRSGGRLKGEGLTVSGERGGPCHCSPIPQRACVFVGACVRGCEGALSAWTGSGEKTGGVTTGLSRPAAVEHPGSRFRQHRACPFVCRRRLVCPQPGQHSRHRHQWLVRYMD